MSNQQNEEILPGGVTQAELTKWKKAHETVNRIDVEHNGETYTCYLKKPDRNTIAFAMTKERDSRIVESGEAILENCWLGGDQAIKDIEDVWLAAALRSRESFDLPTSTIKKA